MAFFLLSHPPGCGLWLLKSLRMRGGPQFESHDGLWKMCRWVRGCGQC